MMKVLMLTLILLFTSCGVISKSTYQDNSDFKSFLNGFIKALYERDKLPIQYPLKVECLSNRSKGGSLNEEEFFNQFDIIFPESIIDKLSNIDNVYIEKKSSEYYVCAIGFSVWNSDIEMQDEYGFHYHFKRNQDGKWKLVRISCIG